MVAGVSSSSTDLGDVSWVAPTTEVTAATWVPGTPAHSWQATAAGGTSIGVNGMMIAAKTLALTALDLNGNAIGDAGAQTILDAPHLRGLARLELSVNPLARAMRLKLDEAFGERWR